VWSPEADQGDDQAHRPGSLARWLAGSLARWPAVSLSPCLPVSLSPCLPVSPAPWLLVACRQASMARGGLSTRRGRLLLISATFWPSRWAGFLLEATFYSPGIFFHMVDYLFFNIPSIFCDFHTPPQYFLQWETSPANSGAAASHCFVTERHLQSFSG